MRAKKDVYMQHDKELADRLKNRNTPIRGPTPGEIQDKKERAKYLKETEARARAANAPFRDRPSTQAPLF